MRRRSRVVATLWVAVAILSSLVYAAAAQGIKRIGREGGPIVVMVDRAITVESAEPFAEVSIAQPAIADVSPLSDRSIYLLGRARGRTTLSLFGAGGRLIDSVEVVVEPDLAELKQRLAAILPGEPVDLRLANGVLVLSGMVSGAAAADKAMALANAYFGDGVLNMMTVGGVQQVALQVRIAEINRDAARELGISTGGTRAGDPQFGWGTGNLIGGPVGEAAPIFTPRATGFGALDVLFSIGDRIFVNLAIDALEEKGFARLLAEPNLVALSGSQAEFLAGGEVPIPRVTDEGQIGVEFKSVGVGLNFVPTVLNDGLINVAVTAQVSQVDPTVSVTVVPGFPPVPGFTVRRATTMVELEDGQSFAIAGLYQNTFSDDVGQVPWLGDVPVVGSLFRSADFSRGETELVVIVTVNRVSPAPAGVELELPTDRVKIPNEAELFLLGRTEGIDDGWRRFGAMLEGPFGYVVE